MPTVREEIYIRDGEAEIITKTVSKIVPLNEVVKNLERRLPVTLPGLARTQVFSHWNETNEREKIQYILCELPPNVRTIRKVNRHGKVKSYKIAIPWTFFWFEARTSSRNIDATSSWTITGARVFFGRDKYSDTNTPFIVAPLPNLSGIGEVCWGSTSAPHNISLADQLDMRVSDWYMSNFNADLDSYTHLPYGEPTMKRWVEETAADPNSWMGWPEWSDESTSKWSVSRIMDEIYGVRPTSQRFTAVVAIPEIQPPYTYGMWEQWIKRELPPEEGGRLSVAIANLLADNPDIFKVAEPVAEPATPATDYENDGGVLVNA